MLFHSQISCSSLRPLIKNPAVTTFSLYRNRADRFLRDYPSILKAFRRSMAVGISASPTTLTVSASVGGGSRPRPSDRRRGLSGRVLLFSPLSPSRLGASPLRSRRKRSTAAVFFVLDESGGKAASGDEIDSEADDEKKREQVRVSEARVTERMARKQSERTTYLIAAVMSSFGITSMAAAAVYYRFAWQMAGGEVPVTEMFGTFALSVGAAVGMEFWARWAHRALWHASLWHMHESHHRPRDGPFELNDVFAIINAVPAIALLSYGFFNRGLVPGLCFGAGLGITLFGIAYMFVHDGLVHRRFPVGPIADVPYFRRVAAAHQIHHSDKFGGVPYGLFMGPKELEEVGGTEELEQEITRRMKVKRRSS